jgi:DNA adenine methylase
MTSPIKWVGGKSKQLKYIVPKILKGLEFKDTYIESFLGGGSVLIEVLKHLTEHKNIICSDINPMLIQMYNDIKYEPRLLIKRLKQFHNRMTEFDYYHIRDEYNKNPTSDKFIYLNKRGFRGLYRVNKRGQFNVPYGNYKPNQIFCEKNIMELSELFNRFDVQFECRHYQDIDYHNAVVYFDPPYFHTFNEYNENNF